MPSSILTKALGLITSPNQLSKPPGSLDVANNVIIKRDGIIESRRGFKLYDEGFGTSTDRADQLFTYQDRILRHFNTTLSYDTSAQDDDGEEIFTDFNGTYGDAQPNLKIRSVEAANNLYFTSDTGIQKIAATSGATITPNSITPAGGIKALDLSATIVAPVGGQNGFLQQDAAVAYRAVWGTIDVNNNLILGVPSQRAVVYNPLSSLLLADYMTLLGALDNVGAGVTANSNLEGSLIDNNNYLQTLGLTVNSTPNEIYTALLALAAKLDADILYADTSGSLVLTLASPISATISNPTPGTAIVGTTTTGIATISFSAGNATTYFYPGDNIYLSGWNSATNVSTNTIDGPQVVSQVYAPVVTTGTTTTSSNIITAVADTTDVVQGMLVTDSAGNLPASTFVVSVAGSDVTISNAATGGTVGDNITFHSAITFLTTATGSSFNLTTDADTTAGSTSLTSVVTTTGVLPGMSVSGAGIPLNTTVVSVSGSTVVISAAATATATATPVSFASQIATLTQTNPTITSYNYGIIAQPSAPSIPATDANLAALQAYIQAIITQLQSEVPGVESTVLSSAFLLPLEITTSADVELEITIPAAVTSSYFLQIYRSQQVVATGAAVLSELVPNDELQQVYEAYPTTAQLEAGVMFVEDETPDSFLGAFLYTNPESGQGILQGNEVPPYALDIARYKNCIFYSNTRTKYDLNISLIGIQQMIADYLAGDTPEIVITDTIHNNTYSFVLGVSQVTEITFNAGNTLVDTAAPASYFLIYSAENATEYYVWYQIGASIDPMVSGATGIEVYALSTDTAAQIAQKTQNAISVVINDFTATSTVTPTASMTTGSSVLTNFSSMVGILPGMTVTGSGIPGSTTVNSVGYNTVTLNNNATLTQTTQLTFAFSSPNTIVVTNNNVGYTIDASPGTSGFTITTPVGGVGESVQQQSVTVTLPVGSTFNTSGPGNYFTINTPYNRGLYYVWYQVGSSTDPAPAGLTGIEVTILSGDTAAQVATATAQAIGLLSTVFTTQAITNTVKITNLDSGPSGSPTNGTMPVGFSFVINAAGRLQVLLSNSPSPATAITDTAESLVRVINRNVAEGIYAFYLSDVDTVPGQMLFEERSLGNYPFYVLANNSDTGGEFVPNLSPTNFITNISATNPVVITTSTPHGLLDGDSVLIVDSNSVPSVDGAYPILYISPTMFSIPVIGITSGNSGAMINLADAVVGQNQVKPQRLYYSKYLQPEAVPIVNWIDIGTEGQAILRIFALRDSLFVFKEDGLFRVSGEQAPWNIALFDISYIVIAPDSLDVSNNIIYSWTRQGIQAASEGGTDVVSRNIDVQILTLGSSNYTNFTTATWGVGYESDNSYLVWTVTQTTDTVATQCFRYSSLTKTWTVFTKTNTCGVVNPADDVLYLGAGDTNFLEQERKTFTRFDYADRQIDGTLTAGGYVNNGMSLILGSVTNMNVGDVITQDQLLTVYEFNTLLQTLDTDIGLEMHNYYATLQANGGDDLRVDIVNLATALDADGHLTNNYLTPIQPQSGTITNISIDPAAVITTSAPHGLITGRVVSIIGSNSTPNVNGIYQVTVLSSTTFSVPVTTIAPGTTGSFVTEVENFLDIQTCYNEIITLLNSDPGTAIKNYMQNNFTTTQEAIILSVNQITKTLTLNLALPFVQGELIVFNAIATTFTYSADTLDSLQGFKTFSPQTYGDPLGLKHLREATLMFESQNFTSATLSFATDLVPAFTPVPFLGQGNGIFGMDSFGNQYFGGGANFQVTGGYAPPFRTYIPRNYQRCKYINVMFTHQIAREHWAILGYTITGEISISTRAYR
jgi:hypothetical protein